MKSDVWLADNLGQDTDWSGTETSYMSATEVDMETDA